MSLPRPTVCLDPTISPRLHAAPEAVCSIPDRRGVLARCTAGIAKLGIPCPCLHNRNKIPEGSTRPKYWTVNNPRTRPGQPTRVIHQAGRAVSRGPRTPRELLDPRLTTRSTGLLIAYRLVRLDMERDADDIAPRPTASAPSLHYRSLAMPDRALGEPRQGEPDRARATHDGQRDPGAGCSRGVRRELPRQGVRN
jgi:hypothetical protein